MRFAQSTRDSGRAVVLLEACVSIMLVGMILGMVSLLLIRYARSTDYFLNHRRAQLAAESCVERMRAGVLDVGDATFTDDAGVTCNVQVSAVEGEWAPLRRVRVTTGVMGKHSRWARYELTTYVPHVVAQKGGDG